MQILKKYFPLLIIVLYFLLQLPFLTADPDPLADPRTRGAFTDEGLYVSQIRNLVNHNYLDLKESDTFVLGTCIQYRPASFLLLVWNRACLKPSYYASLCFAYTFLILEQ